MKEFKSWDKSWDQVYATQGFRGKYPDEFVVRFVARNFFKLAPEERKKIKILDLGCGPGRHLIFLAKEGFGAYGIDASTVALRMAKSALKNLGLKAHLKLGDFINLSYPDNFFDAVIDCASVEANLYKNVKKIVEEVKRVLKQNGKFLSILRTNKDYAYGKAKQIEKGTFTGYTEFDLKDIGQIHFFSLSEIKEVFSIFSKFNCEYTEWTFNNRKNKVTHWIVEATK